MDILLPVTDLWSFIIALLAAGLVAGFLAGIFGIGGGAVFVPVFYQMFGEIGVDEAIRMHLSVGTSLAIIVPTSVRSFVSHLDRGDVDLQLLRSWVIAIPAGAVIAALVSLYISSVGLRVIFVLVSFGLGFKLLFAKDTWRIGHELPQNPVRAMIGGLIGFFSTFMGIGGGVMNNTFMTLYGRPMHQAVSTSSGVGVLISLPGTIGYVISGYWASSGGAEFPAFSVGYVNVITVAFIMPLTLLVAPYGVVAAHALSKRQLEIGFGLFIFLVSARFLYSLIV